MKQVYCNYLLMETDEATSHRESGARHSVFTRWKSLAGLKESFVVSLNGCVICFCFSFLNSCQPNDVYLLQWIWALEHIL